MSADAAPFVFLFFALATGSGYSLSVGFDLSAIGINLAGGSEVGTAPEEDSAWAGTPWRW